MKVSAKQYAQTVYDLTKGKDQQDARGVIVQFMQLLKKNGHVKMGSQIVSRFEDVYNAENSIIVAKVTSAISLDDAQKTHIMKFVQKRFGTSNAELRYSVDPSIKGGIIVRVGDEVIDASIAGRMKNMKKALMRNF
ncbi:MAG: ATP synthase F1 subunit delta [Parcubacteria group bacterium]|jgi:F-type H+-transporting ATPase subunit delta